MPFRYQQHTQADPHTDFRRSFSGEFSPLGSPPSKLPPPLSEKKEKETQPLLSSTGPPCSAEVPLAV